MPYKVKPEQGASVLHKTGEYKNSDGEVIGFRHRSVFYESGEVVSDSDISPLLVKLYDEGDSHILSVLEKQKEPKKTAPQKAASSEAKSGKGRKIPADKVAKSTKSE